MESKKYPVMLWVKDKHDGPMSGIAEYNGKKVYFDCHDEGGYEDLPENLDELTSEEKESIDYEEKKYNRQRTYDLYELSEKEIEFEDLVHDKFEEYVGTPFKGNWDEANKFYSWYKTQPQRNYRNNKLLGTFTYHEFQRPK